MCKRCCRRPGTTRAEFGRQRPAFVAGLTALLFASGLYLSSHNHACQLPEIPGHRCTILGVGHQVMDFRQALILDGRLASGRGARSRATRGTLIFFRGASCVTGFCIVTSWNPLPLRLIQKLRSNQTRRWLATRQRSEGTTRHLHSEIADAVICPGHGRPLG